MEAKTLYTATATATGGRNGHIMSADGILDFAVRMPKELGGQGGPYTNPEQLFAAGYAACFDSALNGVIKSSKVVTGTTAVRVHIGIGPNGNGGFALSAALDVNIPDVSQSTAEELAYKAHQVCPYSNATRGNIKVAINTSVKSVAEFREL